MSSAVVSCSAAVVSWALTFSSSFSACAARARSEAFPISCGSTRDRRTRGRRTVFVKAGTGGRHDINTASIEPHFGMNSRCRVTGSRTLEPRQHQACRARTRPESHWKVRRMRRKVSETAIPPSSAPTLNAAALTQLDDPTCREAIARLTLSGPGAVPRMNNRTTRRSYRIPTTDEERS